MSERTMICNEVCLYVDEYFVTPANCCLGIHQVEAKSFTSNVLPEIAYELLPNEVAKEKKGEIYIRIKDFLALVWDILLPRPQDGTNFRPNGYGVSAGVIFKSYGGSIQPMIWNPENQNGKRHP
jgi:hypothetical protein